MPRYFPRAALAAALMIATPVAAGAQALSPQQRQEVETVLRDYLKRNPEFLIEVLQAAEEKQQQAQMVRARETIVAERQLLTANPGDPVAGNPKGDVTVVEFFDYNCPYCKQVKPVVAGVLEKDRKVRIVYKEFPILGPASEFAARAALAAHKQDKYLAFHHALMGNKARLSEESVLSTAKAVGLDVERMKRDMQDPGIAARIAETRELAVRIGIRGTPALVIGDELLPNAFEAGAMEAMIDKARKG
ncbi:protein-disulfide isomerase [Stella humosa]|uniref:Protein-disulfide isomerase n=1 Tax=Stella humosa TaxID=94 RepID=A0A3N1M1Y5_9PROT|nr:DsbA family protein [Stella humosa]ROP99731.1 protein-disulfide isomerase [Stella humosa]BBK31042.1 DSBA oxidoreductase [Stella humosa]